MPKDVILQPNMRVDLPDLEDKTSNLTKGTAKLGVERLILSNRPAVLDGFRVQIADQGTSPGTFTVVNGSAFDRDGQLLSNEEDSTAARSATIGVNGTYYIEIEFHEEDGDVDARAFWDSLYDNGTDPSGDTRPAGREFFDSIATRKTPDWTIVTPISTTGFEVDDDPDSTKVPIAILTLAGGVFDEGDSSPLSSAVAAFASSGSSSIQLFDTRAMPQTFSLVINSGAADEETVSVVSNLVENNILVISSTTAFDRNVGDIATVAGVSPANYLPERSRATPAFLDNEDARERFFQGNEEVGYGLSIDPNSDPTDPTKGDISVQSLSRYVDFIAAQLKEIKFGSSASSAVGNLAPPASFGLNPRYFDPAGGIQGARSASVTIGDGINTFGDFNVHQAGSSAGAAFTAAIAAVPEGGTLYVKPGTYQLESSYTPLAINKSISIVGESAGFDGATEIKAQLGNNDALFSLTGGYIVRFENVKLTSQGNVYAVTGGVVSSFLLINNCVITGLELAPRTFVTNTEIIQSGTGSLYSIKDGGTNYQAFFKGCILSNSRSTAGARIVKFAAVGQSVVFDTCTFSTPTATYALEFATTPTEGLEFRNCNFDGGVVTAVVKVPTASKLVVVNCTSALTAFFDAADLPANPNSGDFGGLTLTGDLWVGNTITADDYGDISCNDIAAAGDIVGATVATAEGDIKHGDITVEIPITMYQNDAVGDGSGIATTIAYSAGDAYINSTSLDDALIVQKLGLKLGDRIKSIFLVCADNTGAGDNVGLSVYKKHLSGAVNTTVVQLGASQTSSASANYQTLTVALTGPSYETVAADYTYYAVLDIDNHPSCRIYALYVTYDRV